IVFPKSGATVYLEKRAMLPFNAYIVSHLCAINSKSENLLQKFLFYFFVNQKLANKKAEGYPTLNLSEIKGMLIPLPPLEEQRKIAKVLDKIQQAIEVQDKIIQQVKNLKKSLMQKLFTEGLYGEEQKETEIGLIPKSWEVVRLGEIGKIVTGNTPSKKVKEYWENGEIDFIKPPDLQNNYIRTFSERISSKAKHVARIVPEHSVLVS
ncbi:MAG: restriction endonuclease subunit S, partial [Elusimicrobiales bacterium]